MKATFFGIDVGTSYTKGLGFDRTGAVLARAESGYPLSTPRRRWAEQDPEAWWRASSEVLARLRSEAGPPAGIGLTGQMHGLVALDSDDRVLGPAILWNDQRTATECGEIGAPVGRRRLIELTGNRALPGSDLGVLRRADGRGRRLAGGHRGSRVPPLPGRRADPPRRCRGSRRLRGARRCRRRRGHGRAARAGRTGAGVDSALR